MASEMSSEISKLQEMIRRLRGPEGCPWDREQTLESVKPLMLEEVYEAMEAIEDQDTDQLREELGDILLHVVFLSQIASESESFDFRQVVSGCMEKLVRRHPHVFGDKQIKNTREVLEQWEQIKRAERGAEPTDLFSGIPRILPALLLAFRVQERVSRVGFDWPKETAHHPSETDDGGVWAKVDEELGELKEAVMAQDPEQIRQEWGDLLFSLVNLGRLLNLDVEGTLRQSSFQFIQRFRTLERLATDRGKSLDQLTLHEMDQLWEEAKSLLSSEAGPSTPDPGQAE